MSNLGFTILATAARLSKTSTGKFNEPHQLQQLIDERIAVDLRWAVRVLEVVLEDSGSETPASVAHWVTYGKDMRSSRLGSLVAKAKTGDVSPEERALITAKALRYSKQACARMLVADDRSSRSTSSALQIQEVELLPGDVVQRRLSIKCQGRSFSVMDWGSGDQPGWGYVGWEVMESGTTNHEIELPSLAHVEDTVRRWCGI